MAHRASLPIMPVGAKENEAPRPSSPTQRKARMSLNKRVSFGHVEVHRFLKDADRTPSPLQPTVPQADPLLGQAAGVADAVLGPGNGEDVVPSGAPAQGARLQGSFDREHDLLGAEDDGALRAMEITAQVPTLMDLVDGDQRGDATHSGEEEDGGDDEDDSVSFKPRAEAQRSSTDALAPSPPPPLAPDFSGQNGVESQPSAPVEPTHDEEALPPVASAHEQLLSGHEVSDGPNQSSSVPGGEGALSLLALDTRASLTYNAFLANHGACPVTEPLRTPPPPCSCPRSLPACPWPGRWGDRSSLP